jgi:hypothetical protein
MTITPLVEPEEEEQPPVQVPPVQVPSAVDQEEFTE